MKKKILVVVFLLITLGIGIFIGLNIRKNDSFEKVKIIEIAIIKVLFPANTFLAWIPIATAPKVFAVVLNIRIAAIDLSMSNFSFLRSRPEFGFSFSNTEM